MMFELQDREGRVPIDGDVVEELFGPIKTPDRWRLIQRPGVGLLVLMPKPEAEKIMELWMERYGR